MSDSRLEKFIYAICSMDVSDLPVPLSRIEKLWNCLITGETPDFEPLSRNEKYLMAMLDRYDISNLPAPMSRGEKLLYKIAVGETDLSDVPGYLSRYEELLKYLIENGGIGGGDFEYVLHTLNQSLNTLYLTAEKPVKSAILKGNTMKNIIGDEIFMDAGTSSITNITDLRKNYLIPTVKIATNYLVMYELEGDKIEGADASNLVAAIGFLNHNSGWSSNFERQPLKGKLIINSGDNPNYFRVVLNNKGYSKLKSVKINVIEYEEYMNDFDIPYFEGMQSVKMPVLTTTGKNLLYDVEWEIDKRLLSDGGVGDYIGTNASSYINVSNLDMVTFSGFKKGSHCLYDKDKITIGERVNTSAMTVDVSGAEYIRVTISNTEDYSQSQMEKGSVATTYEPYKSNILTVNEEVELCGIGDVKDELDLITGELTQRIGECSLEGSSNSGKWVIRTDVHMEGYIYFQQELNYILQSKNIAICDRLPYSNQSNISSEQLRLSVYNNETRIGVRLSESKGISSLDEFSKYLKSNPIKFKYPLATTSIKTVDLTVVDQDNQPTELGTFENVTHVSLEAENLIPEVEMEVATNLLEDTVFNLTNAFNTLYPTAEKPVKSAILSGQTLVNISSLNGEITIKPGSNKFIDSPLIKQNTTYTFMFNCTSAPSTGFIEIRQVFSNNALKIENINVVQGYNKFKVMTVNKELNRFRFKNDSTSETDFVFNNLLILEGDYTNQDISYFEGMQSVKMPVLTTVGKNLWNPNFVVGKKINDNGEVELANGHACLENYISVLPNKTYHISNSFTTNGVKIFKYDNEKRLVSTSWAGSLKLTTESNVEYIRYTGILGGGANTTEEWLKVFQLEEGPTTTYEPYKTNILSTPEDLELRGIGDVQDTLDCLTGELVQKVSEFIIDKNTNVTKYQDVEGFNTTGYYIKLPSNFVLSTTDYICNSLPKSESSKIQPNMTPVDEEGIVLNTGYIKFRVSNEKGANIEDFKKYLEANPIKLIIPLAEESIKTVDLTVVDQDGNATTLETFDDTTHVLLNSEGLIPTAALTVRTKIPSGSSTSLLMDDISTNQQQLETTVDKQSENVDATMIATTEIYEETL